MSSTGFSLAMSGSTIAHRYGSEDRVDKTAGAGGCTDAPAADVDTGVEESYIPSGLSALLVIVRESIVPTASENITGKSKRGRSMYRNKFSDFSVSDCAQWLKTSCGGQHRYQLTACISSIRRKTMVSNQSDLGRSPRSYFFTSYSVAL